MFISFRSIVFLVLMSFTTIMITRSSLNSHSGHTVSHLHNVLPYDHYLSSAISAKQQIITAKKVKNQTENFHAEEKL